MILHRHLLKGRRCHRDHIWIAALFIETAAGKIGYCTRFFLTLVNKGLVLGSLVVCWAPCQRWSNIQGNGCYCPPIGHIQDHIRWGRGMNSPISLLHSLRWVLLAFE